MNVAAVVHSGGPTSVEQLVACAFECALKLAFGQNLSGAAVYFQIHDKGAAVVLDDVPKYSWLVAAGEEVSFAPIGDGGAWDGLHLTAGCALAWSTTQATFTAPAAAPGTLGASTRTRV